MVVIAHLLLEGHDMKAYIDGIGIFAPDMSHWQEASDVLLEKVSFNAQSKLAPFISTLLPASEKRRASKTVKLALEISQQAVEQAQVDPTTVAIVFASSTGDTEVLTDICETLTTEERLVSPTKFHNSVHNAPAGYWSIAVKSHQPANSIANHQSTVTTGLLEAVAQVTTDSQTVLLSLYDIPFPEPLKQVEDIIAPFGASLIFQPQQTMHSIAQISLQWDDAVHPESTLKNKELEALRQSVPAAKILPLLYLLANQSSGHIALPTNDGTLKVDVTYLQRVSS